MNAFCYYMVRWAKVKGAVCVFTFVAMTAGHKLWGCAVLAFVGLNIVSVREEESFFSVTALNFIKGALPTFYVKFLLRSLCCPAPSYYDMAVCCLVTCHNVQNVSISGLFILGRLWETTVFGSQGLWKHIIFSEVRLWCSKWPPHRLVHVPYDR